MAAHVEAPAVLEDGLRAVRAVGRLDGPVLAHHRGRFELRVALVDAPHACDARTASSPVQPVSNELWYPSLMSWQFTMDRHRSEDARSLAVNSRVPHLRIV